MTLVLDSDQGSRKTEEGPKKNKGKVPLGSKPTGIIKRSSTPSSPTVSNALAIAANLKLPEIKKEPVADSAPTDSSDEGAQIWTGTMKEGKEQLVKLAVALRSGKAPVAEMERRKAAVKSFLAYLEFQATPSPGHREVLKRAFEIYSDGKYQPSIPEDIATQVRDVHQLYEDADWGEGNNDSNEVAGEEGESPGASGPDDTASPGKAVPRAGQPSAQPRRKSTASQNDGVSSVRLPAANHPIWGEYGIMHGLIYNRTARGASIAFNPNLRHLQRSAKQFGHNDLTPGDWWPLQIVAVFHGAHGHNVQGICGSATAGAWSIVCSGRSTYSELDKDQGERLFYSADGSTTNTNPDAVVVPSNMTKALQRSFQTGQPVRVLRSAGKGDYWHPVVGIRYDGLYRIVKQHERHNKLGGMYYSFELERLPGQRSLVDIKNSVPSAEQIAIERKIRDWY